MAFVNARDRRRRNEGMSGLNDAPTPPGCLSSPAVPFVCTRNRTCVQVHAARCVVLDKYFSLRYRRSHLHFFILFFSFTTNPFCKSVRLSKLTDFVGFSEFLFWDCESHKCYSEHYYSFTALYLF